jgi:hypothetical protein
MDEVEQLEGDLTLSEHFVLRGTLTGNVTVRQNVLFELHGVVNGFVYIEPGAEVRLFGTVNGDIHNQGNLHVAGTVNGMLTDDGQRISYDPRAQVTGKRIENGS